MLFSPLTFFPILISMNKAQIGGLIIGLNDVVRNKRYRLRLQFVDDWHLEEK